MWIPTCVIPTGAPWTVRPEYYWSSTGILYVLLGDVKRLMRERENRSAGDQGRSCEWDWSRKGLLQIQVQINRISNFLSEFSQC